MKQTQRKIMTNANTPQQETIVRVTLDLPIACYDIYAERAMAQGRDVEDILAGRLERSAQWKDGGLYFQPEEKKKLETAVGRIVNDSSSALQRLEVMVKLKVGDIEIEVEPRLLQRLHSRVFRGQTFESMVRKQVTHALRVHAGLEPG